MDPQGPVLVEAPVEIFLGDGPVDPCDSLSHRLESDGELWQLPEYAALRSL